jgi:hypothetical protein
MVKARVGKMNSLRDAEPRLFSYLWANISRDSRDKIKRHNQQQLDESGKLMFVDHEGKPCDQDAFGATEVYEDWHDVDGVDPVSLIRRINATHMAPDSGVAALDRIAVKKRWQNCRQNPSETLVDFYERYQHALEAIINVGGTPIEDEEASICFIQNLHPRVFGDFQTQMVNFTISGLRD